MGPLYREVQVCTSLNMSGGGVWLVQTVRSKWNKSEHVRGGRGPVH